MVILITTLTPRNFSKTFFQRRRNQSRATCRDRFRRVLSLQLLAVFYKFAPCPMEKYPII